MRNLPTEIYLKVFQLLYKSDLKNCIVVCKEWSLPSLQIYYEKLAITEHNVETVKSLLEDGEQHFKNCIWVKELTFSELKSSLYSITETSSSNIFTKAQLLKFFTYMPNLKKIKICSDENSREYLNHLTDVDTDKYLTQIEKIEVERGFLTRTPDLCPIYYNFRASLKHAVILHEKESILSSQYNGILNYLSYFKKLTRLEYCNDTNYHVTIYQLQVSCPTLTIIKFASNYKVPQLLAEDNTFYNLSNLTELGFRVPLLSSTYIDLITEHLPLSVKKLEVKMDEINLYDWIEEVGIEKVLKLADCMSKLPSATIECTPDKEYERESENEEESTMTTFFKVLNSFKGNRKTVCSAQFSDFRSVHNTMYFSDDLLGLYYGLNFEDIYEGNQEGSEIPTLRFAFPDKSVSVIGPEIFNRLEFYICSRNDEFAYELLKYSLVNCPYLQYVEYKGMNYPNHNFRLSNGTGHHYSRREVIGNPNKPATTQENLKAIQLGGFIPSSKFLNLMTAYLPNLHSLTCGFNRYGRLSKDKSNKVSVMDITQFKNLKTIYFDINLVLNEPELDACFIKFEFTDGETVNYQYVGGRNVEVKVMPLDLLHENQENSIPTIVFKCDRMMQFTVYNSSRYNLVDFLQGEPQSPRRPVYTDFDYMLL